MKETLLIISLFLIFSCSTSQKIVDKAICSQYFENKYTEILDKKYETIFNKDTITYNEIRFECAYSSLYTYKVMFDKFGKWDKAIYPNNKKYPILVWEKVDLYSNGKKYNVYTNGTEDWKHIYASVMVFDENGTDLLSKESPEKENLKNYFSELIKKQNSKKKDFYKVYWTMVDPERTKYINY